MNKNVRNDYYPDPKKCKYHSKCNEFVNKVNCTLDGSIRNLGRGCPCKKFEYKLWEKIKQIEISL